MLINLIRRMLVIRDVNIYLPSLSWGRCSPLFLHFPPQRGLPPHGLLVIFRFIGSVQRCCLHGRFASLSVASDVEMASSLSQKIKV